MPGDKPKTSNPSNLSDPDEQEASSIVKGQKKNKPQTIMTTK